MLPINDEEGQPRGATAWVTWGIIILNVLVFLYELMLGAGLDTLFQTYGAVPAEILTGQDLAPPGPTPVYLQLLTSMFLHGGWLHLIGNMAFLRVFGDDIEETLGSLPYLLFYLAVGIVASLTHIFLAGPDSTIPSVGASGAIAGVMGAYFVLYPHSRIVTLLPIFFFIQIVEVPAIFFLGIWFVMQLLSGVGSIATAAGEPAGGIAFWAHAAGFLAGLSGVLVFRRRERQRVEWWNEL